MNQLVISGTVLEAKPLRYTPAGQPVLELLIHHESDVQQAEHQRRIQLALSAVALGDVALLLADIVLGVQLTMTGFIAPSRKGSSRMVLHIQKAERIALQQSFPDGNQS